MPRPDQRPNIHRSKTTPLTATDVVTGSIVLFDQDFEQFVAWTVLTYQLRWRQRMYRSHRGKTLHWLGCFLRRWPGCLRWNSLLPSNTSCMNDVFHRNRACSICDACSPVFANSQHFKPNDQLISNLDPPVILSSPLRPITL